MLPLIGLGFVAPLVVWLVFRGRGPYLEDQAKESLNFQITSDHLVRGGGVLTAVRVGLVVFASSAIVQLVLGIVAAVAVGRYEWYRYPL